MDAHAEWLQGMAKKYGIHCEVLIRFGNTIEKVLEAVEKEGINLLVMGANGENAYGIFKLGNLTRKLMYISPCAMIVVRNEPVAPYQKVLIPVDFMADATPQINKASSIADPNAKITLFHTFEVPNEAMMRVNHMKQ